MQNDADFSYFVIPGGARMNLDRVHRNFLIKDGICKVPKLYLDAASKVLPKHYGAFLIGSKEYDNAYRHFESEGGQVRQDILPRYKEKAEGTSETSDGEADDDGEAGSEGDDNANGRIREIVKSLDEKNDALWTSQGDPKMEVIEAIIGDRSITRVQVSQATNNHKRGEKWI